MLMAHPGSVRTAQRDAHRRRTLADDLTHLRAGQDEAADLAIDASGYANVAGSEFDALQPRSFALLLYP
ncbi:hypothetical protein [Nannocystis pusilla]|uniref:hypothetical protein n=1 Tax=Nannocystis pusilla TaxID=889268 RepID=UPI003DA6681C